MNQRATTRRRRSSSRRHLVWGQVMVEFILAAVGIVLLGFISVRVAQWLNATMVARNAEFQTSRATAGREHAGVVPYFNAGAPPLHLIGPGAGTTGGNAGEGGGPSATPPGCSSGEIGLANAAQNDANTAKTQLDALVKEATKLSNDARCVIGVKGGGVNFVNEKGLPDGRRDGGGSLLGATGCYMRSANWYIEAADRVEWLINKIASLTTEIDQLTTDIDQLTSEINALTDQINNVLQPAVDTAQAAVTAAQTALTSAQNTDCGACAITTQCNLVEECDNKGNCTWVNKCVDVEDCTARDACLVAKDAAITAAQAALNSANTVLASAQAALNTAVSARTAKEAQRTAKEAQRTAKIAERQGYINEKSLLCAAAMSGNPLVPGTKPADCTGPDLRDYANNVLNPKAHEWMDRVKDTLAPQIETLSKTIQDKMDEAKNHRAAARVECASGADTY